MNDDKYIKSLEDITGLRSIDAEYLSAYCMFKDII